MFERDDTAERFLIGISGRIASGKSSVTSRLQSRTDACTVSSSNIIAEETRRRHLPLNQESLQSVSNDMREKEGEYCIINRVCTKLQSADNNVLVVDSVRMLHDIVRLEQFAMREPIQLIIVYIDAPDYMRFKRFNERRRMKLLPVVSKQRFDEIDNDPCEQELSQIKEYANNSGIIIDNETVAINILLDRLEKQLLQYIPTKDY